MEHVEAAGVHSGDSACVLPAQSAGPGLVAELEEQTAALARGLGAVGLLNVQFAVRDGRPYVIEANPRASRTVPVRLEGHRRPAGAARRAPDARRLARRAGAARRASPAARSR